MTELVNKPEKNLSEAKPETSTGSSTISPVTKKIKLSNRRIDSLVPEKLTFGNKRFLFFPFDVPLRSHLKGLTLRISKATKVKSFVLRYWFSGTYKYYTLGEYTGIPFGIKEVSDKLFNIVQTHTNDTC